MNNKCRIKFHIICAILAIAASYFIAKNTININRLTVSLEEERLSTAKEVVINIDIDDLKKLDLLTSV